MTWLLLAAGLALLLGSGEFLVRGAAGVARALGISPLFIGLTLVGFGTSAPELVASLIAAFRGSPGIAVGNVVGSNIANLLLILALTAVIAPVKVFRQPYHRDALALALSALVAMTVILLGELHRSAGIVMLLLLLGYVVLSFRMEQGKEGAAGAAPAARGWVGPLLLTLGALVGVLLGARLLVDAAILLAREYGVAETVIGLTVVAVGTSLPELAVCVIAALRGQGAVAVGNVVGSNIYNVFFILGATALVKPIPVPPELAGLDLLVLVGVSACMCVFMLRGQALGRLAGLAGLAGYAAYLGATFS
jgi:cation:H+ antiporter